MGLIDGPIDGADCSRADHFGNTSAGERIFSMHITINALQAIGQKAHVGRQLFELGNLGLSNPLHLRGFAKQIIFRTRCALPREPGSVLLLQEVDQADIDELRFLQGRGLPRFELSARGLRQ